MTSYGPNFFLSSEDCILSLLTLLSVVLIFFDIPHIAE